MVYLKLLFIFTFVFYHIFCITILNTLNSESVMTDYLIVQTYEAQTFLPFKKKNVAELQNHWNYKIIEFRAVKTSVLLLFLEH